VKSAKNKLFLFCAADKPYIVAFDVSDRSTIKKIWTADVLTAMQPSEDEDEDEGYADLSKSSYMATDGNLLVFVSALMGHLLMPVLSPLSQRGINFNLVLGFHSYYPGFTRSPGIQC